MSAKKIRKKATRFNRRKNKEITKEARKVVKDFLDDMKLDGCIVCGEKDLSCLTYHHVNPDEKAFTFGDHDVFDLRMVQKEVDKCVVICENCHRKFNAGNLNLYPYLAELGIDIIEDKE